MSTTIHNSGSGDWTSGSTWQGGQVPNAGDDVALDYRDPSHPGRTYVVDLGDADNAAVRGLMILAKNELNIAAGAGLILGNLIITGGTLSAGDAATISVDTIQNNGMIKVVGGLDFPDVGTLSNTGTMWADGAGSRVTGSVEVTNSGVMQATNGAQIFLPMRHNLGAITAHGSGSEIQLTGPMINEGIIKSQDGGSIKIVGPLKNEQHSQLIADGGSIGVSFEVNGGEITITHNGTVYLSNNQYLQSTTPVVFAGTGLLFFQAHSANFDGAIQGFGVGAALDLNDVGYAPGQDSFDPHTGILTVGATTLQLWGSYAADDFVFRADPDGWGTLVTFNRQGSSAPQTIDGADLQLASLYLGYFGRAGDTQGHAYWHDQLVAGHGSPAALAAIAASFAVQAEAKAVHPLLADPQHATQAGVTSFIGAVYDNLFGRAPDAAGAAYWQTQLAASVATAGVGTFILNVIGGAQAQDAATVANRAEVAAFFSDHLTIVQLAYDSAAGLLARGAIDGVTSDHATVVAAKTAMSTFIDDQQLLQLTGILTG